MTALVSLVKVGILDIGIDKDHEDLENAVDSSLYYGDDNGQEDSDDWSHGSAVAGIVGATGGNSKGISGVASPRGGAFLVAMRATPEGQPGAVDGGVAANALAWACSTGIFPNIKIINNSWGGNQEWMEFHGFFKSIRDAFRNTYLKGLFLTTSAGNSNNFRSYPAAFPDYSTATGSRLCDSTRTEEFAAFDYMDVVAPGGAVVFDPDLDHIVTSWGDDSNDQYWGVGDKPYFGGTSASAAFVAGVAALVWSVPTLTNSLTNDDIDGLLKATATDLDFVGPDRFSGYGLVRADSALMLISSPNRIVHGETSPVRIDSIGTQTESFMNIPCITQQAEVTDTLTVHQYEMVGYASFGDDNALAVWTRGRQTDGWRDLPAALLLTDTLYLDGLAFGDWAEVVDGTVSADGCSLRSYTYKFYREGESGLEFVGWYPVNATTEKRTCVPFPQSAKLAYTYIAEGGQEKSGTEDSPALHVRYQAPTSSNALHRFSLSLPEQMRVEAAIYDVAGRRIRGLYSGKGGPGEVLLSWDARDGAGRSVAAGIYFARFQTGEKVQGMKLLVVSKGVGSR